jgi:hypothetical protein
MLRKLLVVAFIVLAIVVPVWIPTPVPRLSAPRPNATRLAEAD